VLLSRLQFSSSLDYDGRHILRGGMKGYFITFEGIEGSGKTTQIKRLGRYLEAKGSSVLITREPGGTKIGDKIRALLLDAHHSEMDAKTELFLYLASRAQHVKEVIAPALAEGRIVLCDRFTEATLAYQGYGRRVPRHEIDTLIGISCGTIQPHLTLLLDVEVGVGLGRLNRRGATDRLEQEAVAFHEAVRQGYLRLARESPDRIHIIAADGETNVVSKRIQEVVDGLLS